jgi:hypothetical protein
MGTKRTSRLREPFAVELDSMARTLADIAARLLRYAAWSERMLVKPAKRTAPTKRAPAKRTRKARA